MSDKARKVSLDELGDSGFESWGKCLLKVTRGAEVLAVEIAVRSVPHDLLDALRKESPKPPAKTVMLDPKNPDHQALGITTRQKAIIPDYTDPDYVKAAEAHTEKLTRELVGHGVTEPLTLRVDGDVKRKAVTPEDVYNALKQRGLAGPHFAEIANTIMRLTDWNEEEREGFLK